jgi:hypothetical protein
VTPDRFDRYDIFDDRDLDDPGEPFRPRQPLRTIKPPIDHTPTAIVPREVFEPEEIERDANGVQVMSPMARLALDEAREALHRPIKESSE